MKTTKTTRTLPDRYHLVDLLFAMLPTYAIASIIGCSEVYGEDFLAPSVTSTITFKARVLLDSKIFEARAMLTTEVKVVIISPSMLELCSGPRSSKLELECCSTPRSSRLERCSPPRSRSSLSRHRCSSCVQSSSSTTRPRAHLSLQSDQTLCLFPFPSVVSAYVFTCSLSAGF